jgi:hypothetical protein
MPLGDGDIAGMLRGEPPKPKPFNIPKPRPKLGMRKALPTPKQAPQPRQQKPTPAQPWGESAFQNDVYSSKEQDV